MIRKIIEINEEKCNGCGACATACHEGAIEMVNGKAKLTRDDYEGTEKHTIFILTLIKKKNPSEFL